MAEVTGIMVNSGTMMNAKLCGHSWGLSPNIVLKATPTALGPSANSIIRRFCLSASCRGQEATPRLGRPVATVIGPVGNSHATKRLGRHVAGVFGTEPMDERPRDR